MIAPNLYLESNMIVNFIRNIKKKKDPDKALSNLRHGYQKGITF